MLAATLQKTFEGGGVMMTDHAYVEFFFSHFLLSRCGFWSLVSEPTLFKKSDRMMEQHVNLTHLLVCWLWNWSIIPFRDIINNFSWVLWVLLID